MVLNMNLIKTRSYMYNKLTLKQKLNFCEQMDELFEEYYELSNQFSTLTTSKFRSIRSTRRKWRNNFKTPYILTQDIVFKPSLDGPCLNNYDAMLLYSAMYSEKTFDAKFINLEWEKTENANIVFNNEERKLIANAISKIEPITEVSYSIMVKLNSLEE